MKKVILYIAQSLDGYIATKDGDVAWLDKFNADAEYGFNEFIQGIDTVVQGNTTYQQFKDKHLGKNSYVFTKNADSLSEEGVVFVKGNIKKFINSLDGESHKNIWLVGGSNLLSSFLNERQVDELIIFIMPIILKEGIPLFSNIETSPQISLKSIKKYQNGVVVLHYIINKSKD